MAVSETAVASAPVQFTNAPLPADPWDAPYFGGPIYLAYQPAPLPASAAAPATKSAGLPADPWDAPYFGAPVYFRYPDYLVVVATPDTPDVIANPGESTRNDTAFEIDSVEMVVAAHGRAAEAIEAVEVVEAVPARTSKRGGWLARLFGR